MAMPLNQNLELKARCPNPERVRAVVRSLAPGEAEVQIQTDTFFPVPSGRLKLREIEGRSAELIWYERPDREDTRTSRYYRVPVADPGLLKLALGAGLGVRGVVRKRREITLWHNVRFHLDEVDGLGTFLEFEAVITTPEQEAAAPGQLQQLCERLSIRPEDVLAPSYADLLGF